MYKTAKTFLLNAAIVGGMLCFPVASGPASAQDKYNPEPPGNFMVHVMGSYVAPDAKASDVVVGGAAVPTADADISSVTVPTLSLTYFLNPNFAVEAICCFTSHKITGKGGIAAAGQIADTWLLPATITAQYHFTGLGGIKPYIGAGVSAFYFFSEKAGGALANTSVDIDPALGFALQAGADFDLGGGWYARADVKKIFIDTKATWKNPDDTVAASANAQVDPLVVSVGLGYRFNLF